MYVLMYAYFLLNRLYLICKKLEPQLTSELCINTTVVNFSATFKGLQGQLLSSVIKIVSSSTINDQIFNKK